MPHPIDAWHAVIAHRDAEALAALLADDATFHSPIVHTPQVGKALTLRYLGAALHVFLNGTFRYVREVIGERDAILEFVTEMDGIVVNGVDMIHWNDEGRITDFKVMIRPLKGMNVVREKMAAMLESMSGADSRPGTDA